MLLRGGAALRRISKEQDGEHKEHAHKPDRPGQLRPPAKAEGNPARAARAARSLAGLHSKCSIHSTLWFSGCRFVPEYSPDAARTDAILFASKQEQRVDPDLPRQYPSLAGAEHRQGRCPGVGGRTGRGKHRDSGRGIKNGCASARVHGVREPPSLHLDPVAVVA